MSTPIQQPRRSRLMRLLRLAPAPIVLLGLAGGALMLFGAYGPSDVTVRDHLWAAGTAALALSGVSFCGVLWGGVYLNVVEASRGMPGLRVVDEPAMPPAPAAKAEALKQALTGLGFRPAGWFVLDDFDETHIGAWTHDGRRSVAFVMYFPAGGLFRLRFVCRFPSGGILASSTRLNDLAYAPPQGLYLQARKKPSVEELWAWHQEAESLFPVAPPGGDAGPVEPRELYVEVSSRWAGHRRRDRTWLLSVEPIEECWRMYWLCGMPLRRQFELGWTTPFWQ